MLQRVYKMRCSAILGCFWILWSESEENRRLYCKIHHIKYQNDFWPKKCQQYFLSQIWEFWTDVPLHIVKLESGGQQIPVIKENHSGNRFNLAKLSFLLKVLKTYAFTQITECSIVTHLHHPELKSRAYIQP